MPPIYEDAKDINDDSRYEEEEPQANLTQLAFWYMIVLITLLLIWLFVFFCLRIIALRQKTRNPQERRAYVGSRPRRSSFGHQEPTIYVSPSNLPPPPKYECMAPPSYEEVVGVHYPQFQVQPQPITHPIATAMAHQSTDNRNNVTNNVTNAGSEPASTVITVSANERRTSVTVATSQ